jgi:hypothetical protein
MEVKCESFPTTGRTEKHSVLRHRVQLLVTLCQVGCDRRETNFASLDFCHSLLTCYVNGGKHMRQTFLKQRGGRDVFIFHYALSQNCKKKATVSFAVCVCLSASPSVWTARLPLDGFWWNLIFEYFFQKVSRKFKFCLNLTRLTGTLHEDRGPLMVAQWLRYCATSRKVASSIPDGAIGIFHWHNPSDRTMALGSTQPLTEMSTRSNSWG